MMHGISTLSSGPSERPSLYSPSVRSNSFLKDDKQENLRRAAGSLTVFDTFTPLAVSLLLSFNLYSVTLVVLYMSCVDIELDVPPSHRA